MARRYAQELSGRNKTNALKETLCIVDRYRPICSTQEPKERGSPDVEDESSAFVFLLRACARKKDLCRGSLLHEDILEKGLLDKCADALVKMYAKCGALEKAKQLLKINKSRDVPTWTAVIAGFTKKGQAKDALKYFELMQKEGLSPDAATFSHLLKACGTISAVDKGKKIHDEISKRRLLGKNIVLGNALVDMYVKCGALSKARRVLEELPSRNVISWNTLITGYAQQGEGGEALSCYEQMQQEGLSPDAVTFICVLKACGSMKAFEQGEKIHNKIANLGLLKSEIVLGNALLDMYAKCGALAKARRVLEEMPIRDVISWTALISGYTENGEEERALDCFQQMQDDGVLPNAVTFIGILKACRSIGAAEKGEKFHDMAAKRGLLGSNIFLGNAVIDMYAKCGALAKARKVLEEISFRNIASWNALITGCIQRGKSEEALDCFEQLQREGLYPDAVTYICMFKACGSTGAVEKGAKIYEKVSEQGLLGKDIALDTAVVDMYAKCGAFTEAWKVLEKHPICNVIPWNALLTGFAQKGDGRKALDCFEQMKRRGLSADAVTFSCILKACGSIGAADVGETIHDEIAKQGLLVNSVVLGNAIVDMYAKCGSLDRARTAHEELRVRNSISWNTLIAGYAQQGETDQALTCFELMQHEGLLPDATTFSSVLCACSLLNLVNDAQSYITTMATKYGMKPALEHYTGIIDLFGRMGHLVKAVQVFEKLPSRDSGVCRALLGACWKWGDASVGRWVFEHGIQIDKSEAAFYVFMGDIYAGAGMYEEGQSIEAMKLENKACEKRAQSG